MDTERDFEHDDRMTMLMSKILIPPESERAIHQDSTYPSDSLVGHLGMLLRDITVKGFQERPQKCDLSVLIEAISSDSGSVV